VTLIDVGSSKFCNSPFYENSVILGYYAASIGNRRHDPTFRGDCYETSGFDCPFDAA